MLYFVVFKCLSTSASHGVAFCPISKFSTGKKSQHGELSENHLFEEACFVVKLEI